MLGTKNRLQEFIKHLGMTNNAFEREVGLSNGFVDKTTDRIRKASLILIQNRFPELNMDWVVNGRGKMLKDNTTIQGDGIVGSFGTINKAHNMTTPDTAHRDALMKHISELTAQLSKSQDQLSIAQQQITKAQEQIDWLMLRISTLEKGEGK